MARERLTKSVIDKATPGASAKGEPADAYTWDSGRGSVSGFGLKVSAAGSKSFVFQYRLRGAKSDRRIKIGRYGDWTLDQARDRARELRRKVDSGIDPLDDAQEKIKAAEAEKRAAVDKAFNAVIDRWLDAYRAQRKSKGGGAGRVRSAATIAMVERTADFLKAAFGTQRIDEIDDLSIEAAFTKIPAAKLATRRNHFACARIFWRWCHRQRLVAENPFSRLEPPAAPPARDRVLSDDELAVVWRASRKLAYPFGPLHRLLMLTGQRRDEVAGMTWSELDRDASEWRIAADRVKNGLDHIVPLSPAAIAELDAIAPNGEWPTAGLIFTITGKTSVSGFSAAKRRLDAEATKIGAEEDRANVEPWRVHDLRRTVATGLQRLGVRFEVTEAVLNHVSGARGGIAGVYQRHNWKSEKREALDAWSEHVLSLVRPRAVELDHEKTEGVIS